MKPQAAAEVSPKAWSVILAAAVMSAVLAAAAVYQERRSRIAMYGGLQDILQSEIERHSDNMEKLDQLEKKIEKALKSRVQEHDRLAHELKMLRTSFLGELDM